MSQRQNLSFQESPSPTQGHQASLPPWGALPVLGQLQLDLWTTKWAKEIPAQRWPGVIRKEVSERLKHFHKQENKMKCNVLAETSHLAEAYLWGPAHPGMSVNWSVARGQGTAGSEELSRGSGVGTDSACAPS